MKIYIYGLFDPREPDVMRYVGQTANLANRFTSHAGGRDLNTKTWVRLLKQQGVSLSMKVLETSDDLNAMEAERKWINHYKETCNGCNIRIDEPKQFEFRISPIVTLRDMELRYIQWALKYTSGNKLEACRLLGIGRQTLYNKLKVMET